MKKTSTQTEYLFDKDWRGQIETSEKDTTITIFNEDNKLVLTEDLKYAAQLHMVLGKLLEKVKWHTNSFY